MDHLGYVRLHNIHWLRCTHTHTGMGILRRSWESQMTVLLSPTTFRFSKEILICATSPVYSYNILNILVESHAYICLLLKLLTIIVSHHYFSFFMVKSQLSRASFIFDYAPSFSSIFPPLFHHFPPFSQHFPSIFLMIFHDFPSIFHMFSTIFPAFSHPISSILPRPGASGGQDHPAAPGRVGKGR